MKLNTNYYVPILKGKMGEYSALKEVAPDIRDKITPLIEIPPIPWDYNNDAPSRTIDAHLSKVTDTLGDVWGENRQLFMDLNFLEAGERMADGSHPLIWLFNDAGGKGLPLIPTTGLSRDRSYQTAVASIATEDGLGLCMRLESDELDDDLESNLENTLGQLRVDPGSVDLLIDLKEISATPEQTRFTFISVVNIFKNLPKIDEWRSLILSGTSFPQTLSEFEANTESRVQRTEWLIWRSLFNYRAKLKRLPTFSDYTIVHPEPFEMDPRMMQLGAKVKYTTSDAWIIIKGQSIRRAGASQTHSLCQYLVGLPDYRGENFSWGDKCIFDCANTRTGPGNQTTWVRVGVSHHIAFVVDQIANLLSS
jgi:hypothetical protein